MKALPLGLVLSLVDDALGSGVALVQGPAGNGNSTLATQWLAVTDRRAAVVRLDRRDDDPVRFWTHVAAAAQARFGEAGGAAQAVLEVGGRAHRPSLPLSGRDPSP